MISKQTKKIISLAMSITVNGSVISALTAPAITVFAEQNNKTKAEINSQEKNNSNNEENEDNIKLLNNVSNVLQSTTGQSVSLLNVNEDSDDYDIDLYANGDDSSWTTTDEFNGEGSTVKINNIEFKLKDDNTVEISNGQSYDQEELILPEKIAIGGSEYEVTSVGDMAFYRCKSIKNISLSKVTYIGKAAFQFTDIKSISLPKVTSIGKCAFYGCKSIKSISLPEVSTIGNYIFESCDNLESISLPEVTSIGEAVFKDTAIKNISLPKVTSIGKCAFYGCNNLKSISLSEVISIIGDDAFYECSNLESISLPEVTSIGIEAFYECSNLKNIELSKVTSIGYDAFNGCSNLKNIELSKITSIGNAVFRGSSFESISLPEVTSIGYAAFNGCSNLESISLPEATSIGISAFENCSNLKSINLPKATSIGDNAFDGCGNIQNAIVSDDLTDTTKIPANSSIIKVKDNGNGYTITDIEKKSEDKKILLPSEIGGKPVTDISDEAIEVIKNNSDKVQVDSRSILNILKNENVDISKMDITITPANKTELESYYKQNGSDKYEKNNYTADSYNFYENSLRKADEVLNDKYVSQEDVDNTLETLKNAVFKLIKIDKNKLTELYNKYKDLKQGNYTDESYGKFIEALKNAETVINNGNAVQNDVNDAFKNLQDAVNGLKEKSSGSNSGSSSSSSHRSSRSHKSSSKKDSESEVKSVDSVDSVVSEEQDNEIGTATQYKEGWNKTGESWIYIKNGVSVTGWTKDTNGKWYYLNSEGMQTGWLKENERWYYLGQSGDMKTGWQYINGAWYYLNEESDGYMGVMKTGWIYIGGRWYLLNQSGQMKTGWVQDKGKWYYLNEDGSMAVNTIVDGYSIGADGVWI